MMIHDTPIMDEATAERFWARVHKSADCWEWRGPATALGYGRIRLGDRKYFCHRLAWVNLIGPIPKNAVLDHKCHNPSCVKPDHLQVATHRTNSENRKGPASHSKSGIRGVFWHKGKGKWETQVISRGKKYRGYYTSLEEAKEAVIELRMSLHTNNLADR